MEFLRPDGLYERIEKKVVEVKREGHFIKKKVIKTTTILSKSRKVLRRIEEEEVLYKGKK